MSEFSPSSTQIYTSPFQSHLESYDSHRCYMYYRLHQGSRHVDLSSHHIGSHAPLLAIVQRASTKLIRLIDIAWSSQAIRSTISCVVRTVPDTYISLVIDLNARLTDKRLITRSVWNRIQRAAALSIETLGTLGTRYCTWDQRTTRRARGRVQIITCGTHSNLNKITDRRIIIWASRNCLAFIFVFHVRYVVARRGVFASRRSITLNKSEIVQYRIVTTTISRWFSLIYGTTTKFFGAFNGLTVQ